MRGSTKGGLKTNLIRVLFDGYGMILGKEKMGGSYYKYHQLMKRLNQLKESGYSPDVVVMEWTDIVLLVSKIQKLFPNAKYVASEHDVSFLGARRRYEIAQGQKRKKLQLKYELLKKQELEALHCCNLVVPHNEKDKQLLLDHGIPSEKIFTLTAYYHSMCDISRREINNDILFWGAMYREENYGAVLWFIEHVMPLLGDTDVRFVVAGNRPPEMLKKKANDRIIITGFVEDVMPYFAHSLCFVAPLKLGAGIKVKILEAMSAGIPILTNDIGIEGVPATHGVEYFHCTTPEDYANTIRAMLAQNPDVAKMEAAQRMLIDKHFDLQASKNAYVNKLNSIMQK